MPEFDKKVFGELLENAKGDRSINNYALHSGVDASHISRFIRGLVKNPPSPTTIKKLSDHAQNDVTYEELMEAAGHIDKKPFQQLPIFDLDENGTIKLDNVDSNLYQFIFNFAKQQIQINPSDENNKSAILIAFNAFELRLNEVLIKCFVNKTGLDEHKAFNYVNSLPIISKIEIHLQMDLDFDITKEECYKDLMKYMEIRDKILHGVYRNIIRPRHARKIFDVIENTIKSINQQSRAKGIL